MAADSATDSLMLDDFSDPTGLSRLGTQWEGFTDRVMGGVSDMTATVVPGDAGPVLRMRGRVSLENNGGFIQVRLPLATRARPFDAGAFRGVALTVRGSGSGYYVHLRSTRTRFPWSYYAAELPVSGEWTRVELPFDSFGSEYMMSSALDPSRLLSVAVVAAKKEFAADIEVARVELYR